MMSTNWIKPLCRRTKQTSYIPQNMLLKVFSIIVPVFGYIFLNQMITMLFAYLIGTGQYGTEVSAFFSNHSLLCAAIIRNLSVILATLPLLFAFVMEYPVVFKDKDDCVANDSVIWFIAVIVLATSMALLLNALAIDTGFSTSSESFSKTSTNQFSLPIWLGILVYGIVTPVTEEIVHRGIIYNRARNYFSPIPAMVCSAFMFGFSHGNMVQLVYGFMMGMVICYIYERFGLFIYPVIFHCAANISVYVVMSIPVARNAAISIPGMMIEIAIMLASVVYIARVRNSKNIDTY